MNTIRPLSFVVLVILSQVGCASATEDIVPATLSGATITPPRKPTATSTAISTLTPTLFIRKPTSTSTLALAWNKPDDAQYREEWTPQHSEQCNYFYPTLKELNNATYRVGSLFVPEEMKLVEGEYREPVPNSTAERGAVLVGKIAFGSLDKWCEVSVVVIYWFGGGTGRFYQLMVMTKDSNGNILQIANEEIGDRSRILKIRIENNEIVLVARGWNAARPVAYHYAFQEGVLTLISTDSVYP